MAPKRLEENNKKYRKMAEKWQRKTPKKQRKYEIEKIGHNKDEGYKRENNLRYDQ